MEAYLSESYFANSRTLCFIQHSAICQIIKHVLLRYGEQELIKMKFWWTGVVQAERLDHCTILQSAFAHFFPFGNLYCKSCFILQSLHNTPFCIYILANSHIYIALKFFSVQQWSGYKYFISLLQLIFLLCINMASLLVGFKCWKLNVEITKHEKDITKSVALYTWMHIENWYGHQDFLFCFLRHSLNRQNDT